MGEDSAPIDVTQVRTLLIKIQHRGGDATGIAVQKRDGSVRVCKGPEIAWKILSDRVFARFLEEHLGEDTMTVLLHTRLATLGSPDKNENNHPVYAGGVAVTHNGMIHNHRWLFDDLKLERKAEVDTDIIRAILDAEGLTKEGIRVLNKLGGSAAIAAVTPKQPDTLLLARSGSPLVIAMLEHNNQLMWASEKEAIHAASRVWVKKWGFPFKANRMDLKFNTVEKESAFIITSEGVQFADGFSAAGGVRSQVQYNIHRDWERKQRERRQDRNKETVKQGREEKKLETATAPVVEQPDVVVCPAPSCKGRNIIDGELKKLELWEIECGHCKRLLGERGN